MGLSNWAVVAFDEMGAPCDGYTEGFVPGTSCQIFNAEIAHQNGESSIEDVVSRACQKLIQRHPHVFENPKLLTPDEVQTQWIQLKKAEKAKKKINRRSYLCLGLFKHHH